MRCFAIERNPVMENLKGKAFVKVKGYEACDITVYYLRIGLPLSRNSRVKILGKAFRTNKPHKM